MRHMSLEDHVATGVAGALVAVLLAATAYEVAAALGTPSVGPLPGIVLVTTLLAMLGGAVVSLWLGARRKTAGWPAAAIPPAAAAFMVARFYTYDPYYAPTLRRASEGGAVSATWTYAVATAAILAAGLVVARPRTGLLATVPVLLVCGGTALFELAGH